MKHLTKAAILAAMKSDLATEDFDVPAFGGAVRIRELSGRDRDRLDAIRLHEAAKAKGDRETAASDTIGESYLYVLSVGLLDPVTSQPMFTRDELRAAYAANATVLRTIADRITTLGAVAAKDIADLGNASAGAPSAASGSN